MTPILDAAASLEFDPSGVHLIEASAGTGKTYTIANLYLRHLLAGRRPSEILVVTYTNAATAELQERIHARIYQTLRSLREDDAPDDEFLQCLLRQQRELDDEQRQSRLRRLSLALRIMDEAAISTIHGFCQAALIDHAFLGNREFDSEVIASDDLLWEQALKDWWRRNTYGLDANSWQRLHEAVDGIEKLGDWQRRLRQHPGDRLLPEIEEPLADLLREYNPAATDAQARDRENRRLRAASLSEAHGFAVSSVREAKRRSGQLAYQDLLDDLLGALDGPVGRLLAARLRARFPVALIDEFQDTDPVQFGIFQRLYLGRDECCLTLIGDPKQAIYGFRGGDIFTYIGARSDPATRIHSLRRNWRSAPALVHAVNHVFMRREDPFIFTDAIDFEPAEAADSNAARTLSLDSAIPRPLTLWKIPLRDDGKTFGVALMRARICRVVCALLDPENRAQIGERTLQSRDIAILVRDHIEAEEMRAALARGGIRALVNSRDQVFSSAEAGGLFALLDAIAHPRDDSRLRRACASSLFAREPAELAAVFDDDRAWQEWCDRLQALHQRWQQSGFIAMYQQCLRTLDLAGHLARQTGPERRLTNLGHLAELLQQQSRSTPGPDLLLAWFQAQTGADVNDAAELRLESDAELVRIVTLHKSKGLEYPVVFLPFAWRCRTVKARDMLLRFHDSDGNAYLDLGDDAFAEHLMLAERERLAEDLRLLYVAMTRAQSKLYLAWGDVGDGRSGGQPKHTALAWLLHSRQTPDSLTAELPDGITDQKAMFDEIDALARDESGIDVTDLPDPPEPRILAKPVAQAPQLQSREFERDLGVAWRINSFSSLTRDVHQAALHGDAQASGDAILDFPAGSHVGLLLHDLLEHLDFTGDIAAQAGDRTPRLMPAYGLQQETWESTLLDWLGQIVTTEFGPDGLCLRLISRSQRLNELKFDFALHHFDSARVNRVMQSYSALPLQPIEAAEFRGLLTGVVDLVFEFGGRYYLADYKSNYLGSSLEDYAPAALARAMAERRYDLQATIYTLALDRYLATRIADYDYERDFGGNYYLFLRAMRRDQGNLYGVHFDRPSRERIEDLRQLFDYRGPQGISA